MYVWVCARCTAFKILLFFCESTMCIHRKENTLRIIRYIFSHLGITYEQFNVLFLSILRVFAILNTICLHRARCPSHTFSPHYTNNFTVCVETFDIKLEFFLDLYVHVGHTVTLTPTAHLTLKLLRFMSKTFDVNLDIGFLSKRSTLTWNLWCTYSSVDWNQSWK